VIRKIKHKGLKRYFEEGDTKGLPAQHINKIQAVLAVLDTVSDVKYINIPGGRLHRLMGERKGYWSLTIKRDWRITFQFDGEDVTNLDYEDYH
jgi:proteic killer suppression protein